MSCLTKAIAINPFEARYYQTRGDIRLQGQQYASAIEDFTKAIEQDPDSRELYESRGFAYGELGKKDSAIKDFERVEELTAENAETQSETNESESDASN